MKRKMKTEKRNTIIIAMALAIALILINTSPQPQSVTQLPDGVVCEDSDGGNKVYQKGYIQLSIPDIDFIDEKVYDYCTDSMNVAEYSCSSNTQLTTFTCPQGCYDGACKPDTCIDDSDCESGKICSDGKCFVKDSSSFNFDLKFILMLMGSILIVYALYRGYKK